MASIEGLASGLDVTTIIEGLLTIQQRQIDLLSTRAQDVVAEQTAFKTIEAQVINLRSEIGKLNRSRNNVFETKIATSSDETIVQAAATTDATPGVYNLGVNNLARAHQISSQEFASSDTAITQGTIDFQVGTGSATTITIDSTNDTLQGLADSINASNAEISAQVINDGSGSATPYRLLLVGDETGVANSIDVTNNLAASGGGLIQPMFERPFIGDTVLGSTYTSVSKPTSNAGTGYTGGANDTYYFTVTKGAIVGDKDVKIAYQDGSGENGGEITIKPSEVDTFITIAEGVQIKLSAGNLIKNDTFTVEVGPLEAVQFASDASITLGSGAGAIEVFSSDNQFDDIISGVALNVTGADSSKDITISVNEDTAGARTAITDFVNAFNSLMSQIDDDVRFDSESGIGGVLLGNRSVITIQDQIRQNVNSVVGGVSAQVNQLSALGIDFDSTGKLTIDSAQLDSVLSGGVDGITLNDVRRVFALDGLSDNSGIEYIGGSTRTTASATSYQVDITQAAEQATVAATNTLAASITINSTNKVFSLTLDGQASSSLTLTEGVYTRDELAVHLSGVINDDITLGSRGVEVSLNSDKLVLTSEFFGISSAIINLSGNSLTTLGFTGGESDVGQDVVGKFVVDGVDETAIGNGRILIGDSDNENTADLQVRVTLTSSQVVAGTDANLTVTRGITGKLDQTLTDLLDPVSGRVKTVNNAFADSLAVIQESIDKLEERFEARRNALVAQFVRLEIAISEIQSTGNFLATQLLGVSSLR